MGQNNLQPKHIVQNIAKFISKPYAKMMLAHVLVAAILFQSWTCFLLILAWLISLVAIMEPSRPTNSRHADVAEFMSTDIGEALVYRRFWVPKQEQLWVAPLCAILLFLPGAILGWNKAGMTELEIGKLIYIFAMGWAGIPVVINLAWLFENIIMQPFIIGPCILFYVSFLAIFAYNGKEEKVMNFILAIPIVIAPLYTLDLLRLLRRSHENRQKQRL